MNKKENTRYICSECGYISLKWMGYCPGCQNWNSFTLQNKNDDLKDKDQNTFEVKKLNEIVVSDEFRFSSGSSELNRVLGGGIVAESAVLVGGEPGIGKSTLLIQIASYCSETLPVLYISGEESASQIKQRFDRLQLGSTDLKILCTTSCDVAKKAIINEQPVLVIVDSLQTLSLSDIMSSAGSVSQMKACCMELSSVCKQVGATVFFIGHVTKEGVIAGPKIIEHLVDTVLYFEEGASNVRLIRAVKNRFGSVDEIGLFVMRENGLRGIKNPESYFITERIGTELPSGTAYASISEGSRVLIVEIQALVVEAKSGYGKVYSDKIDNSRVQRISAIIEKHLSVRLNDKDIYLNVAGGIKVDDVSVDLAIAMSLLSAVFNKPISSKMLCIGELSLAGEIRAVNYVDKRVKSALEMGLENVIISGFMKCRESKLNIIKCNMVSELIRFFS